MVNNFGAFTVSSSSSSRQLTLDSKRETEGDDWIERGEFTPTDDKAETGEEKKRPNARITETPLLKARVRQLLFSLVSPVLEAILAILIPALQEDIGKLVERVSFVGSSAGGSDCGRDGGGSGGDDDKLERRKSLILMTVGAPIGTNCCCSLS